MLSTLQNNHNLLSNVTFPVMYTGQYTLTDFGRSFADDFSQKAGIEIVLCSCFIVRNNMSISIHARGLDFRNTSQIISINASLTGDTERLCPIVSKALSSLINCDTSGKYSNAINDILTVDFRLYDYNACMREAFFSSHLFAKTERDARLLFADSVFIIRYCGNNQYYLIFETDRMFEEYNANGTALSIAEEVNRIIAAKDYLKVFENNMPKAIITSDEEIKRSGRIMGIMRNNPAFDSWFGRS